MKIAIVFSSPRSATGEFENVWKKCPESRELDPGKLVIERENWKVFAFDGLNRKYYYGAWNMEALKSEITAITENHMGAGVAVLLHSGTFQELTSVTEHLRLFDLEEIYTRSYAKEKGTFYKKCIKPFSQDGSEGLFEALWARLKSKERNLPPKQDLASLVRHPMRSHFICSLGTVESFCTKPNDKTFQKIHRLLAEAGAIDRAAEILSDLRVEYGDVAVDNHPEIQEIQKALDLARFFLDFGFDGFEREPKHLKEFRDAIRYLSRK
jgi:hypothetical protein